MKIFRKPAHFTIKSTVLEYDKNYFTSFIYEQWSTIYKKI